MPYRHTLRITHRKHRIPHHCDTPSVTPAVSSPVTKCHPDCGGSASSMSLIAYGVISAQLVNAWAYLTKARASVPNTLQPPIIRIDDGAALSKALLPTLEPIVSAAPSAPQAMCCCPAQCPTAWSRPTQKRQLQLAFLPQPRGQTCQMHKYVTGHTPHKLASQL